MGYPVAACRGHQTASSVLLPPSSFGANLLAQYPCTPSATTDRLDDISGNAKHGYIGNSGGTQKPTQNSNRITFPGGGSYRCCALHPSLCTAYRTVIMVVDVRSRNQTQFMTLLCGPAYTSWLAVDSVGGIYYCDNAFNVKKIAACASYKGIIVVGITTTGANRGIYINGQQVAAYTFNSAITQESASTDEFLFGATPNSGTGIYGGDLYYLTFLDVAATPTQHTGLAAWHAQTVTARSVTVGDTFTASTPTIVFDGNSRWLGAVEGSAYSVPYHTLAGLSTTTRVVNAGYWGQTVAGMLSSFPTRIAPFLATLTGPAAVVVGDGVNDIYTGATPAAVWANLQSYAALVKAVNPAIKVLVPTCPRRIDTASEDTDVASLNTLTVAGGNIDAVPDYSGGASLAYTVVGSGGDFNADGVHLVNAGYVKEKTVLLASLSPLGFT